MGVAVIDHFIDFAMKYYAVKLTVLMFLHTIVIGLLLTMGIVGIVLRRCRR